MAVRRTVFAGGQSGKKSVRSVNVVLTDYKRFKGLVDAEAARIMQGAAEIVLEHTYEYVPVDTGALKQSGTARVQKSPKGWSGKVTFGGLENPVSPTKNAPQGIVFYALMVHENAGGNGFKFLEQGAMDAAEAVEDYVVAEFRKITP